MRENAVRRSQIRYQAGSWNFTGSARRLIEVESRRNPEGRTQGPAWTAVLEFLRRLGTSGRPERRKWVRQSLVSRKVEALCNDHAPVLMAAQ
jgi:hypothetical protein